MLMFILLLSSNAYAVSDLDVAKASLMHVEKSLTSKNAEIIAKAILKHSIAYNLDWEIMAAIIDQESSFRADPQQCLKSKKKCADLGIAQINYATWGQSLHLDRVKLLTDIDYNIETMAKIMSKLKEKYGNEKQWHTRFHSFTPSHRRIYAEFIYHKYLKISSYANGYSDGSYNKKGSYVVSTRLRLSK